MRLTATTKRLMIIQNWTQLYRKAMMSIRFLALCFISLAVLTPLSARTYTLGELQEAAVQESRDLQLLEAELEQSMIDLAQARAGRWPEVSLLVTGSYIFNPMDAIRINPDQIASLISLPDGFGPAPGAGYVTLFPAQEPTYYQFGLTFNQPVFTWGKISNSIELYQHMTEVNRLRISQKEREIRSALPVLVHSLGYLGRIEALMQEQLADAGRLVDIVRESYDSGFVVFEDVLSAQIQAQELEVLVLEIAGEKQQLLERIARLTGIHDISCDQLIVPDDDAFRDYQFPDKEILIKEALSLQREPVKILSLLTEVQELALKITEASVYWKPNLGLRIDVGYSGSRFPLAEADWFRQNDYDLNITVALETTLWDGGKRLLDVKSSAQDLRAAEIKFEDARQEISSALTMSLLTYDLSQSRISYHKLKEESSYAQLQFQQRQYDAGVGGEADLISAKIAYRARQIETYQQMIEAVKHYYTIQGIRGI